MRVTSPAKNKADDYDFGPTIANGEIRRLSVSQVEQFDHDIYGGCHRKWFLNKVCGHKVPTTKSQAGGKEVHEQIEVFLKTGEDVLGPIARSAKHFIPPRSPALGIEAKFGSKEILAAREAAIRGNPAPFLALEGSELTAAGVPFVGFIDLVNPSGVYVDEQGELQAERLNVIEACDWKTSKSIDEYAKPGSALIRTVQMPGYGELLRRRFPGLERVRLSHVTMQTEGKRLAVKTTALVTVEQIVERWKKVESTVREMKDVAREKSVEKVEANTKSCSAYGKQGCPYKGPLCPRSNSDVLADVFGGKLSGVMSRLRGIQIPQSTQSATPPPAPAAPAVTTPPPAPAAPAPVASGTAASRMMQLQREQQALLAAQGTKPAPVVAVVVPAPAAPVIAKPPPTVAAPAGPVKTKAMNARVGHRYGIPFGGATIEATFVCRTKGGLSFKPEGDGMPRILSDMEDIIVLGGPVAGNAVLPPDAPQSGQLAPKAEPVPVGTVLPPAVAAAQVSLIGASREELDAAIDEALEDGTDPLDAALDAAIADAQGEQSEHEPVVETLPAPVEAEAPRKRGRPPGSKNKKTLGAEAAATATTVVKPNDGIVKEFGRGAVVPPETLEDSDDALKALHDEVNKLRRELAENEKANAALRAENERLEDELVNNPASAADGITLFVDAMPAKGKVTNLDAYVAKLCAAMCEAFNVGDIRLGNKEAPQLDFMKWKGALAALIRSEPPAPGSYFLLARGNDIHEVAAQAIATIADVVVKGV